MVLDRAAPEWIHIMPAGRMETRDDRKPWTLNDPEAVIAASNERSVDLVIDFEHQSDYAAKNGQPAPAAGWIQELAARADGIWGRVEWTERARKMIEAAEYRYLSPTFTYDKASRAVTLILRAALTNNPALHLTALATKEDSMDFLKALAALLGLPEDSDEATVTEKLKALAAAQEAAKARIALLAGALDVPVDATDDAIATAMAALGDGAKQPDPAQFVPMKDYQALSTAVATLQAGIDGDKAEAAVEAAIAAGKITPAQRDWALGYAKGDVAAFDAFVETQPVIVQPGDSLTGAKQKDGPAALTDSDLAVCKAMGIDVETFKKTREQE